MVFAALRARVFIAIAIAIALVAVLVPGTAGSVVAATAPSGPAVLTFGDAPFYGTTASIRLNRPVVGMAATPDGGGYWLVASDGGIFTFGDAPFYGCGVGSLGSGRVAAAVIGSPTGRGYDILATSGTVRIGFAGDVNGVGRVATLMSEGGDPLAAMRPILGSNDVNLVNLETSVGSAGQAQNKQYTFQSPPELLYRLRAAGVSVVNLANNHSLDFGVAGLLQTISDARAAGLLVVGAGATRAEAYSPAVVDTPAGRVAFLGLSQVVPAGWAATATQPGVASAFDLPAAIAAVREARSLADQVVVMVHAGVELNQCPTADQYALTKALVGAGANVVVGSHPHVLQGLERIGSALVDYSLGDFVWYAGSPQIDVTGLLSVELGSAGADTYEFTPAVIDATGSPQPLTGAAASGALANLASLTPGSGRC
ncbi:MAG TPA: CapA family protein [Acidimicrobiales bacterium]|nr:CapA family protein [Acidimicrobiales bacterium]